MNGRPMNRTECERSPEFVPEWDVFRDDDGNPVTITWKQVEAIWRAYTVWQRVCAADSETPSGRGRTQADMTNSANWQKSRLLGRMLTEGRPPTRTMPPVVCAEPRWDLLPNGDPFVDRNEMS